MQTQLGSMPAAPTGAPVGPASPATAPIQSGSPAVSAAPSSLGPGTTAPFSRGPGIMASASSGLAHAAAGPATTPVQSGSASFSAAPPSPLSSGTTAPVSAGLGPAAPHRLSAVSGPGSGYWNLSPGVHVPSGGKASGGLASLVAARSAVPGPTISSGM